MILYYFFVLVILIAFGIFIYFGLQQCKYIEKQKNKHPQFKSKDDYFAGKDNRLKEPADLEPWLHTPDKEETAWTHDSIYEALGKIDWCEYPAAETAGRHGQSSNILSCSISLSLPWFLMYFSMTCLFPFPLIVDI